ncbi:MAG: HAMP domain-containing sensor histidine kinase [Planctomycetota bacterium]
MTSPLASTSPAAGAEPTGPPARSLARALAWIFVPLCLVLLAGGLTQFVLARAVHHDVQRLFEELREIALARTLVDEVRGVQQWIEAAPAATATDQPLVLADVRQHHVAATAALARFVTVADPSRPDHEATEKALLARLAEVLGRCDPGNGQRPLRDLTAPVRAAMQDALALTAAIGDETRELGADLDTRSRDMAQFLLMMGITSLATVGGLGLWLLARVLRPVRALRAAAVRLGQGELDAPLGPLHPDELGDLATTFRTMAQALCQNQRELEQRVEARSREVLRTAKLAQLGTLAAGIAHEINNPLASIVACTDGLLRDLDRGAAAPGNDLREYLQILRKEAMRARDITVRLLRFARHDPGQAAAIDLAAEAREVGILFSHQLADAGVRLLVEADRQQPVTIQGDPAEWRQVVFNLLRNALDVSPRGGTITVAVRRHGTAAELVVRDDGPGMPPADLDRIFEPFYTTKEPGKGTGLGLAIVHRIVTAHRGRVAASNGERGAVFTITVPAAGP